MLPAEMAGFFVEYARHALPAVQGRLELVDGDGEPCPGVRVLPAPGTWDSNVWVRLRAAGYTFEALGA